MDFFRCDVRQEEDEFGMNAGLDGFDAFDIDMGAGGIGEDFDIGGEREFDLGMNAEEVYIYIG